VAAASWLSCLFGRGVVLADYFSLAVIPAQAGIKENRKFHVPHLDSRLRGNDEKGLAFDGVSAFSPTC